MASDAGLSSHFSPVQTSAEFPPFETSYRWWWEDEGYTVMWAFNVPNIREVIRYGLFRDENFPRSALLLRNADRVHAFLVELSEPHERQRLGSLSHQQRVDEILRRSRVPPVQQDPWMWFPPQPGHALTAEEIADAIEAESHCQFRRIAFEDVVRGSLGYKAVSVEWFLQQHTVLCRILLDHLQCYPEEIPLYKKVEEHLRAQSPFAHRALTQCIHSIQPDAVHGVPQPVTPGFEFLAEPLQKIFKGRPPSLTTVLKVLSVLAFRFKRQYIDTRRMEWRLPLSTSILFLEDYLNSTPPEDLARTLTKADELELSGLSRQSGLTSDALEQRLLVMWHNLSNSVWECCAALPDMVPFLQKCAQALLNAKNYHSLMALADALNQYITAMAQSQGLNSNVGGIVVHSRPLSPEVAIITNPADNYASYRQQYREHGGVPFLIPHLREFQQRGELAIQPLLQYLQDQCRPERKSPDQC